MKSVTEWQQDLVGMVLDINPAEIGSHLEDLGSWCKIWKAEMIRKIYDIPATYGSITTIPVNQRVVELGKETIVKIGDDPYYLNTITTGSIK